MPALRVRERSERDEPTHLRWVVVLDSSLEVLALRSRLAQLTMEPAEKAHGGLIRHAEQAIAARAQPSVVSSGVSPLF